MKSELLAKEKKYLADFSGLVSFIEFLERSNAELCLQIESLSHSEVSRNVLVMDYEAGIGESTD